MFVAEHGFDTPYLWFRIERSDLALQIFDGFGDVINLDIVLWVHVAYHVGLRK
jgi:hypothetical protein